MTDAAPKGRSEAISGKTADPVAEADALVSAIDPRLGSSPGVERRDAVLVTGPWLAGTTSLVAALRERMPEQTFIETTDLDVGEAPSAIVFVASAATPLTESDCALLDSAAANTDLVICAVSKTDMHRNWRDVLEADKKALAERDARYRDGVWVGVAAAPELGQPNIDELVDALAAGLADQQLPRRNRLRAWQTRLRGAVRRHDDDAAGIGREARMAALREERSEALRQRRLTKSERTAGLRNQIQQARVQLSYFARNRCTSVREELQDDVSGMTRRRLPEFENYVRNRSNEVVAEVNSGVTEHLADVATEFGLTPPPDAPAPPGPPVSSPALKSRKLETRLMMVLGAGFGLGVTLTLIRLFTNLAPAYTAAAVIAGALVGLAVTVWVVRTRGVLHDRAVLDRWVSGVIGELRAVVDQLVASRVLQADKELTAAHAEQDEADAAKFADRVAGIDSELREHAVAAARATALRDREVPTLRRALEAVQAELDGEAGTTTPQPVSVPQADVENRDDLAN